MSCKLKRKICCIKCLFKNVICPSKSSKSSLIYQDLKEGIQVNVLISRMMKDHCNYFFLILLLRHKKLKELRNTKLGAAAAH